MQAQHKRNQYGAGGGAGPERPTRLAWGEKGLVGRENRLKCVKLWEVDWSF